MSVLGFSYAIETPRINPSAFNPLLRHCRSNNVNSSFLRPYSTSSYIFNAPLLAFFWQDRRHFRLNHMMDNNGGSSICRGRTRIRSTNPWDLFPPALVKVRRAVPPLEGSRLLWRVQPMCPLLIASCTLLHLPHNAQCARLRTTPRIKRTADRCTARQTTEMMTCHVECRAPSPRLISK